VGFLIKEIIKCKRTITKAKVRQLEKGKRKMELIMVRKIQILIDRIKRKMVVRKIILIMV
jgi:hypothetical protein